MSVSSFLPGQRWVSNTESELGLGIVLETANRRVELSFPAAGERRTYAVDNAPLSRVRYEVGQRVSNAEGKAMSITAVEEHNGGLIYLGCDDDQQDMVLPELELDSFVQFSKPQDRLFAGQIDQNRAFQLRLDTLDYYRRLQQSPTLSSQDQYRTAPSAVRQPAPAQGSAAGGSLSPQDMIQTRCRQ